MFKLLAVIGYTWVRYSQKARTRFYKPFWPFSIAKNVDGFAKKSTFSNNSALTRRLSLVISFPLNSGVKAKHDIPI